VDSGTLLPTGMGRKKGWSEFMTRPFGIIWDPVEHLFIWVPHVHPISWPCFGIPFVTAMVTRHTMSLPDYTWKKGPSNFFV
jgi:hypothetical protein